MTRHLLRRPPPVWVRIACAMLLGFAALIATGIGAWVIVALVLEPTSGTWQVHLALATCLPIGMCLWLLSWRALIWRSPRARPGRAPLPLWLSIAAAGGSLGCLLLFYALGSGQWWHAPVGLLCILWACQLLHLVGETRL